MRRSGASGLGAKRSSGHSPLRRPRSRGPQANRDRQLDRSRPGRPDPYRADQRAVPVRLKGTPAEYSAGLNLAIERGWLGMHESGHLREVHPSRRGSVCLIESAPTATCPLVQAEPSRGPFQSSMPRRLTRRFAFSIAAASSAHTSGSKPLKWPSCPMK
jgi:hypothetical protein